MSSTLDRLRRLHDAGKKSKPKKSQPSTSSRTAQPDHTSSFQEQRQSRHLERDDKAWLLQEAVGGEELVNEEGCCYLVTHAYALDEQRGPDPFGTLLEHTPDLLSPFHPNFNLHSAAHFGSAAFIDTETTGLGGGAGVYTFMVGVGRFEAYTHSLAPFEQKPSESKADASPSQLMSQQSARLHYHRTNVQEVPPTHFVVRQLFMRKPAEELALLVALNQLLSSCGMTVSFNGRTFDLPLLRTRYQQNQHLFRQLNQQTPPLLHEEMPHLDLLIPARRLWRRRLESCRLGWLEQQILGLQRTADDVPGHMIPQLYNEYVRSGDLHQGQIPNIFYHNREDIASMVPLAAQIYHPFHHHPHKSSPQTHTQKNQTSTQSTADHGLDWLSLGCCFESIGRLEEAESLWLRALKLLGNSPSELAGRMETYRRLGQLYKRQEAWPQATTIWQEWLSTDGELEPTPYVELAKYCEWQTNDLEQAEMWTRWALHNLQQSPQRTGPMVQQIGQLEYRLARIVRKRNQ
ncbi:MAG: ribonuclease H-like domain-containing protein [Chloroflexota bacterium]